MSRMPHSALSRERVFDTIATGMNERPPTKKRLSKSQWLVLICALALFDTGWAWERNSPWLVIDIIFYSILFLAVVMVKKPN